MTKTEGIRLVTELEAERILLGQGWTKVDCPECNGAGRFPIKHDFGEGMARAKAERVCQKCEGNCWKWKAPDNVSKH